MIEQSEAPHSALNYLAPVRTTQSDAANTGRNGVTPLSRVTGAGKGWTTAQIADQAVMPAKLSNPSDVAVVTAAGAVSRASTGTTGSLTTAPATYTITFANNVSQCGYTASIGGATAGAAVVAPFHVIVQCWRRTSADHAVMQGPGHPVALRFFWTNKVRISLEPWRCGCGPGGAAYGGPRHSRHWRISP